MKKTISIILCILAVALCGCSTKQSKPATLPSHDIMGASAKMENVNGITGAYILASDCAVNLVTNEKRTSKPEYISFDFGTSFALKQSEQQQLVAAMEVYGVPIDTDGIIAHNTLADKNRGFVLQYIVGSQHNKTGIDFTITVEVVYANKGFAYYFDFNIFNGEYVLVNYEPAYENMR